MSETTIITGRLLSMGKQKIENGEIMINMHFETEHNHENMKYVTVLFRSTPQQLKMLTGIVNPELTKIIKKYHAQQQEREENHED